MQTEIDKNALGKLLRSLRTQKDMNQKELARQLNVTAGTVSKWETGVNLPDTPTLCNLADFYGIPVDDLFHPRRTDGELVSEDSSASIEPIKHKRRITRKTWIVIGILALILITVAIVFSYRQYTSVERTTCLVSQRWVNDPNRGMTIEMGFLHTDNLSEDQLNHFCDSWIESLRETGQITEDIHCVKFSFYPDTESALNWEETDLFCVIYLQ